MNDSGIGTEGQPGLVRTALLGLCPRCGERTLFGGVARFAPQCGSCGLDYGQFNVGDGPAAFLTLIIGAVIMGLVIWLQLTWSPPFWVHVVLWVPLTGLLVVWGLRAGKAALLGAEFARSAREAGGGDVHK